MFELSEGIQVIGTDGGSVKVEGSQVGQGGQLADVSPLYSGFTQIERQEVFKFGEGRDSFIGQLGSAQVGLNKSGGIGLQLFQGGMVETLLDGVGLQVEFQGPGFGRYDEDAGGFLNLAE